MTMIKIYSLSGYAIVRERNIFHIIRERDGRMMGFAGTQSEALMILREIAYGSR